MREFERNILRTTEHRQFLHSELRSGIDKSKDEEAEGFMENLWAFLQQNADLRQTDSDIVQIRQNIARKQLPSTDDLLAAVDHEISYLMQLCESGVESPLTGQYVAEILAVTNTRSLIEAHQLFQSTSTNGSRALST